MRNLVAGRPVRAPRVQGIQQHVAPLRLVKLRQIFHRRVVHDGGFSACPRLGKYLPDRRDFLRAAVARENEVHPLPLTRDARPSA